jgi:hypothetical protein
VKVKEFFIDVFFPDFTQNFQFTNSLILVPPGHMLQHYIDALEETFLKEYITIHVFVNNPPNISDPVHRDDVYELIHQFENYTSHVKNSTVFFLDDWFEYMFFLSRSKNHSNLKIKSFLNLHLNETSNFTNFRSTTRHRDHIDPYKDLDSTEFFNKLQKYTTVYAESASLWTLMTEWETWNSSTGFEGLEYKGYVSFSDSNFS